MVSEQRPESVPPAELKAMMGDKPLLIRNLGYLANNAGLLDLFNEMLANDMGFIQIKRAIEAELQDRGIVDDAADLLTLFDIPKDLDEN